jgi:PQQ-dependent dehydrogenase (methanol/ethanol family)
MTSSWRCTILVLALPIAIVAGRAPAAHQPPEPDPDLARGTRVFEAACSSCHGHGGVGGDRGPAIVGNRRIRGMTHADVEGSIRIGTPNGMPAFGASLPADDLRAVTTYVRSLNTSAFDMQPAGDTAAGERFFFAGGRCATCHTVLGRGIAIGPDLSAIGRLLTLADLSAALTDPAASIAPGYQMVRVRRADGTVLEGFARNEGNVTLPLQTIDGHVHSFAKGTYTRLPLASPTMMPPLKATATEQRDLIAYLSRLEGGSPMGSADSAADSAAAFQQILSAKSGEWPTYHGRLDGNRFSALTQINAGNVASLALQWVYPTRNPSLEMTPLVVDGVMYITAPSAAANTQQISALDARSGREIWRFRRPKTPGIAGDAGQGLNRGVAVLGNRVFYVTDNAHVIALNRTNGSLLWESDMVPPGIRTPSYGGTSAPLVVHDLVIVGISGGDMGIRGFVAAYQAATGKEVWRFWTVPEPGEPGSETWGGNALTKGGGGATWLTGTYDPETDTLYWPTGNPYPDTDGSERQGDNLYTNCVLALDARTGRLRWHFQFTPHDLHDWDAQEPPVLVNARFQGRDRKLLLQANRNGFFYVLDRTTGQFLLGQAFVQKLTWASAIGPDGRPTLLPNNATTEDGTTTCPAIRGATNWMSTSYDPSTRLFYVMAVENCSVYRTGMFGGGGRVGAGTRGATPLPDSGRRGASSDRGVAAFGGTFNTGPNAGGTQVLRALDIETGKIVWEIPQIGSGDNYAGTLATAGAVLFYAQSSGEFAAVDAKTGRALWHYEGQDPWKASPMTYMVDGRQYVAIAAGSNVLSFALPAARVGGGER